MITEKNDLTVVLGGVEYFALLDSGVEEKVKIRAMKLKQSQTYLRLASANNESGLIELFCEMPEGWADSLSAKSQEEILKIGEELNADFMMRSAQRAAARREKLTPGFEEKAIKQIVDRLAPSLERLLPTPGLVLKPLATSPLPNSGS